jgi:hypothetical protein
MKVTTNKSGLRLVLEFFNSKKSRKIFTRAEYFSHFKGARLAPAYLETIRCYLERAGYLVAEEAGVYRKLRPIPTEISGSALYREAYGK